MLYLVKIRFMFKKFTTTDILMFVAAFLSLIFSEILWFSGDREAGIFIGIWVPSIMGFAIYLKLINKVVRELLPLIFYFNFHLQSQMILFFYSLNLK